MSVLATLLHFSRAVIHAHNNAKVRNLMDASAPDVRNDARRQTSPHATENKSGATHPGGR